MSIVGENSGMYMPVAPAYGAGGMNNGFGWGDGSFWIIILFLFMFSNGWGGFGGYGGGGMMMPWMMNQGTDSQLQRGFDQQSVMAGINGINAGINSLAQGQCAGFAGVNQNVSNVAAQGEIAANARQIANMQQLFGLQNGMNAGFSQAELGANTRQMADMQQNWNMQSSLGNQLNTIAMNQQNCCCENRAAVADLKYTVATEACADRAAVEGALRDVTAQGVANTQALLNTINGGIQSIKDQLCQDKIDAKNETIANLRQEIAMKDLAASQQAQNAFIQQGFSNEVDQLYNRLNNCPVPTTPVYGRTPIFTCGGNQGMAGCNCGGMM